MIPYRGPAPNSFNYLVKDRAGKYVAGFNNSQEARRYANKHIELGYVVIDYASLMNCRK